MRTGKGRLALLLLALVAILFTAGCYQEKLAKEAEHGLVKDPYPQAPKNHAHKLRVLIWPEILFDEIKADFEKRYGIELEVATFKDDDELYDMLTGNPDGWDVIMASQYMADRLKNEGFLRKVPRVNPYIYTYLDTSVLNKNADPQMNYFIPFDYAALGISFNINYMAGFPRGWDYIADPQQNPYLYGRVFAPDDMRYAMSVAMLYDGVDPSKATLKDVENAKNLLIANVKLLGLRFASFQEVHDALLDNEAMMAMTWSATAADVLREKQECRFLVPEGKCIMTVDGFSMPEKTPHPETAALFIEYMLQPYVSLIVANKTMFASANLRTMKYVDRFIVNGPSCMVAPPEDQLHMKLLTPEELKIYEKAWAEVKAATIDSEKIRIIPVN
jgi:spermidine/putrescine transport system substrate-binding protein